MDATAFRKLSQEKREKIINSLTADELLQLKYFWTFWARSEQLEPAELGKNCKFIWFVCAGRGFGKTRALAEWVINKIRYHGYRNVSIVGAVADEVREIMLEGESGILSISPPDFYPDYQPSKKKLVWPNGAVGRIYYGSEPEKSRGAQSDLIWCDEIVKWRYTDEAFTNLLLGLRLGDNPLMAISSTPKPTKFIKELIKRDDCIVTTGSTYDNQDNLSPVFISAIIKKYEGVRIGAQELYAKILEDNPNALWKSQWFDRDRVTDIPDLTRIYVGVDPPASEHGAECGIIVAGVINNPEGNEYYVLEDVSIQGRPEVWAAAVVTVYNKYKADKVIAEKNNGGEMIRSVINNADRDVNVDLVHASRGKYIRAEPISLLYEKKRVHHVGNFLELEQQCNEWEPGGVSPDRLDALVWVIFALSEDGSKFATVLR